MIPQSKYDYDRLRDMAACYIEHCQRQINAINEHPEKFQDIELKAEFEGAQHWASQFYKDCKVNYSFLCEVA